MRTRQTVEHPILAELIRPEPNYPLARLLASQIYKLTTMFERYIAALFYRCPVREFRAKLAENLYEEVTGKLSKTDGHLELMERFIFAIGLTREDLDATVPLPETQDLIDYRVRMVDDPAQYHKAFGVVLIMEYLSRRGRSPQHGFLISAIATTSLMIGLTVSAHAWSGTPHLIASAAPSVLIGTAFIVTYSRALWILRARASAAAGPATSATGAVA